MRAFPGKVKLALLGWQTLAPYDPLFVLGAFHGVPFENPCELSTYGEHSTDPIVLRRAIAGMMTSSHAPRERQISSGRRLKPAMVRKTGEVARNMLVVCDENAIDALIVGPNVVEPFADVPITSAKTFCDYPFAPNEAANGPTSCEQKPLGRTVDAKRPIVI